MKILLPFLLLFSENLASSLNPIHVADNEIAKVNDGASSSTSIISVIVTPLNDTLVANDITVVVEEDVSGYEIKLSATDAENSTLTFSIVDSPLYGEVDTTTLGDSRVRAYESRNAGQHQHNSHYTGSPRTTIEGQANAVVSHLVNGHPSAIWREIYSTTADDPWVSTYSRGTDGELRPSLLSTVGPGLGSGFKGGHLFVPEVMFETFKAAFNETGQAILEDTANYVMFGDTGGKVLYTPNENFFGTDSFTYVATDNNGVVSSKATVSITVTPVSDEPTSIDATLNLSEDSTGFIILPGSDADGDTLTFTVGAASNGTVTLVGDTALYTPNPNYNGKDSFVYTVSDGISSSTSTITITVAPVNDVPVADDISVTVAEDSSVTITLSASDVDDTTNSSVEFFQVGEEYVGANDFDRIGNVISLSGDGSTIAYGVSRDDTNGSNTGLVKVFRKEGNNLSQLGADIYGAEANDRLGKDVSLNHDGTILAVTSMSDIIVYEYTDTVWIETGRVMFSENDDDEPIFFMDYTIQLNSDGTILSVSGGEYEDTVVKIYKKQTDNNWSQLGSEITGFRYLSKNSMSLSSDGLTIAIGDPSNADIAGDAGEARVLKFIDGDWTQLGSDLNGENNAHNFGYSTSLCSDGSKLAVSAIRSSSIGYVKTYEYVDSDWIQLGSTISGESRERFGTEISLSGDGSLIAISAVVHNEYRGRVAVYQFADSTWSQVGDILEGKERFDQYGESVSLSKDASTLVIGSANGSNRYIGSIEMYELEGLGSSELTYSVVGQPTYGSLDTVSTETPSDTTITVINYTPEKDYNGSDTFTYTATDSKGGVSDKATVSITVTPVNDAPTSSSSSDNLDEDALTTFYLSGEDIDGDTLTYIITDSVKNGTIELIDIFGLVKYIPDSNFFGIDSVKFKVNDGILDSDTSTFTLTINSVYDLPEIIFSLVDSISTEEDESTIPISIKLEGVDAGDEYVTFDLMLSGTASDSDYTVSSTSVVMDTGVVEATANITIIDDAVYEEEETIVIGVENVSNALDTVQSVTITILRNDVPLGENSHRIISRVYPNPAKDYFTIEFSEIFELEEIDMVDPLGRVYAPSIIEINKKQLKIDSSILSGGTHILRLKTDKGSASFRIIVE